MARARLQVIPVLLSFLSISLLCAQQQLPRIAYDVKHFPLLKAQVTADRVKAHFAGVVEGSVVRYELPKIGALNFVMTETLGGGVTRSLALDAHGKSLSSALLDLEIEAPPETS